MTPANLAVPNTNDTTTISTTSTSTTSTTNTTTSTIITSTTTTSTSTRALNHKAAGRPNEVKESLLNPIFGSGPWSNAGATPAIAGVASAAAAAAVVVVATSTTGAAATAAAVVVVAVVSISSKFEGVQVPRSRLPRNARALTATTDRVHKLTLVSGTLK
ncbi:hypothetical protein V1478_005889 [Vespula squamosa]|uniref:Uncharacterized protein n=1 Tax=Vespula squamosa TaxID=30214 RepID=A0ABD2BA64_VESSQ